MRRIFFGLLIVLFSGLASAQQSIREVDFKNFIYPLSGPLLGHSELKWLGRLEDGHSKRKPINLVHGQDGEGFTLQSVSFSNMTGDGQEDAIVVLLYQTGGTQNTHYVYIYSFADGKPKLLAYCHTGSRGYSGLYRVYGERGALVFELLDQKMMEGECCSSGFVRTRYQWRAGRFEAVGAKDYGEIKEK